MSNQNAAKDYLAEHPRMIGALFALMLLLGQAGSVAAGVAHGEVGP